MTDIGHVNCRCIVSVAMDGQRGVIPPELASEEQQRRVDAEGETDKVRRLAMRKKLGEEIAEAADHDAALMRLEAALNLIPDEHG